METHLRSVIKALDLAADDDRIGWLVLDLDEFSGGLMPHLERVGDAIREFRHRQTSHWVASRAYSQSSLLLAEADEIPECRIQCASRRVCCLPHVFMAVR